jgi:hypothetical protein
MVFDQTMKGYYMCRTVPSRFNKTIKVQQNNQGKLRSSHVFSMSRNFWTINYATCEGPEKATRGGGEWEPIKITHSNLAYIPNLKIRHALSLEKNGQVLSLGQNGQVLMLGKTGQVLSPGKN